MASQFPEQQPPQKSGGSVVKVLLIILIVVLVLCAGVCGGCIYMGQQAAKKIAEGATLTQLIQNASGPANTAIRENEAVKAKFGENLELSPALPDFTQIKDFKDFTNVPFIVMIKGEKGEGTAHCRTKEDGTQWKILEIKVKAPDGSEIVVPPPADAPPELQFDTGESK